MMRVIVFRYHRHALRHKESQDCWPHCVLNTCPQLMNLGINPSAEVLVLWIFL
jgi:hypothetical protein